MLLSMLLTQALFQHFMLAYFDLMSVPVTLALSNRLQLMYKRSC